MEKIFSSLRLIVCSSTSTTVFLSASQVHEEQRSVPTSEHFSWTIEWHGFAVLLNGHVPCYSQLFFCFFVTFNHENGVRVKKQSWKLLRGKHKERRLRRTVPRQRLHHHLDHPFSVWWKGGEQSRKVRKRASTTQWEDDEKLLVDWKKDGALIFSTSDRFSPIASPTHNRHHPRAEMRSFGGKKNFFFAENFYHDSFTASACLEWMNRECNNKNGQWVEWIWIWFPISLICNSIWVLLASIQLQLIENLR